MVSFPAHLRINKFGYTMLELMVVMGVMGVLSGISFFGYRSYERSAELRNAQRNLVNDLRQAQQQALTGVPGTLGSGDATHWASFGEGADFYLIDYDDAAHRYSFGKNVKILAITLDPGTIDPQVVLIHFFHPSRKVDEGPCYLHTNCCNPDSYFNCSWEGAWVPNSADIIVTLEHSQTLATRCVRIDGEGLRVHRIYEVACP